jgi:nucleotide-binding universal stress UspA family protein
MAEKQAVVVAVDGSDDSERAVGWAVPEARRRGLRLVAVHAVPHLLRDDEAPSIADQRTRVDRVLQAVRQQAAHAPATEVEIRRLEPLGFEVAGAVVDAVGPGDLLVLGARGHGKVTGLLLGSVSQYAVRHAPGTVVVVRDQRDGDASRTVVGLDDTDAAYAALEWALDRAATTGDEVTALRAWHAPALAGAATMMPLPEDAVYRQDVARDLLETDLAPWREKFPGVLLTAEAVPGRPGHLLAVASQHAALVVVGSRHRGPVAGTLLGSVGQAVVHHAACPVAVVR